jgi:acetyl-CoA acetyltransferase
MDTKLGKYNRGVSIIGVGCSPFKPMLDSPETAGVTDNELFAWSALEAMEDAGIEGKDVDAYIHGQLCSLYTSKLFSPNVPVADWIGMRGKPSFHTQSSCATPHLAFELAVMAVASGKHDIVLAGGVELGQSIFEDKPAHRRPITFEEEKQLIYQLFDTSYTRYSPAGATYNLFDDAALRYATQYGLTDEQLDDAFICAAISLRRNAARNPEAYYRKEFKDLAKEAGFDDVMAYMKSYHNPKITRFERLHGMWKLAEGSAAVIVCPTEMAKSFAQQPVEVLGTGFSPMDARHPHNLRLCTDAALKQVYKLTGVKPEELGLFQTTDFMLSELLETAEMAGYLPAGEGWRYLIEGRTAFDGDKPINTNGGHCSGGHAYGATIIADFCEVVRQMRGQCGDRQVKKLPETTMVRGAGGGQLVLATILRTVQ